MASADRVEKKEKPFEGKKVYFSGSISGVAHPEPFFFHHLVRHMVDNGADVLSEHVGGRSYDERETIRTRRLGFDVRTLDNPAPVVRRKDIEWVEEATHVVAVVDTPSTGVGMEVQHALNKHRMGMNLTPVLCLVQKDILDEDRLTDMIGGINMDDSPVAYVIPYTDMEDAKNIITNFLTSH